MAPAAPIVVWRDAGWAAGRHAHVTLDGWARELLEQLAQPAGLQLLITRPGGVSPCSHSIQ